MAALRPVIEAATRTRRRRTAVFGSLGLAVISFAVLGVAFGVPGAIGWILAVQLATIVAVLKNRVDLANSSRARYLANQERFEQELRARDARIDAIERSSASLADQMANRLTAHARVLAELERPEEAADALDEALGLRPDDVGLRTQHHDMLVRCGEQGAAARFINAIERQHAISNYPHARSLAETGIELAPSAGRLHDLYVATLDIQGDDDVALDAALEGARAHLRELRAHRGTVSEPIRLTPERRVLISGFFYSGSGAVLDHLRGFDRAAYWPRGEMRLIKFPGGLADLGKRLTKRGELRPGDLVDLYLHVTGAKLTSRPRGTYDRWRHVNHLANRMFNRDLDQSCGYLIEVLEGFLALVERVRSGPLSTADFEQHFREVLERGFDAAATDNDVDHLLIDQAVTAWRLEIARFLPPSSFVVVHRDPRDQYAEVREVMQQPGRSKHMETPEGFAETYRNNRAYVEEQIPKLEQHFGHRFLRVAFEDLVIDHKREDQRLRAFLGLEDRRLVERRFKPKRSRVNVGKHAALLDETAVRVLSDRLSGYLHPHATPDPSSADAVQAAANTALGWERAKSR